jgi:hypothetical protein
MYYVYETNPGTYVALLGILQSTAVPSLLSIREPSLLRESLSLLMTVAWRCNFSGVNEGRWQELMAMSDSIVKPFLFFLT